MRDLFLKTLTLLDESGAARRYDYYITVDQVKMGQLPCESYGVKIVEQGGGEAAVAAHVTCSQSRIDELSELLLRNGVTPVTLKDVVCDWL